MRNIRCLLGLHLFTEWEDEGYHRQRQCTRCPKVEVRVRPLWAVLALFACDVIQKELTILQNRPPKGFSILKK